ncbi:dihydropteroate synthase [Myxococcota bacterium]|nr:dihydropteroate synthase [Myxococcota bacterium]
MLSLASPPCSWATRGSIPPRPRGGARRRRAIVRWAWRGHRWSFQGEGAVRLMGVLNVTPDSFSDGGRFTTRDAALRRAARMIREGAEMLDIGGESTRPGAAPVSVEAELARVIPVIEALAGCGVPLSIDTMKAAVAEAALAAGASVVNDISALDDPLMAKVVAEAGAGLVLMHMRGRPADMQRGDLSSPDIVEEVRQHLAQRLARAVEAGVDVEAVVLDPGIGFGKTVAQNVALIARLDALAALGRPVLLGASRKSFLGALTGQPVEARAFATAAACACGVMRGAQILRVHDIAELRDVARISQAIAEAMRGDRD